LLQEQYGIDIPNPRLNALIRPKELYDEIQQMMGIICSDHKIQQFPLPKKGLDKIKKYISNHTHTIPEALKDVRLIRNRGYFIEHQPEYTKYLKKSDTEINNMEKKDAETKYGTWIADHWTDKTNEHNLKRIKSDLQLYSSFDYFLSQQLHTFSRCTNIQPTPPVIVALLCSTIQVDIMRALILSFLVTVKNEVSDRDTKRQRVN
jgi:hypothetical protein